MRDPGSVNNIIVIDINDHYLRIRAYVRLLRLFMRHKSRDNLTPTTNTNDPHANANTERRVNGYTPSCVLRVVGAEMEMWLRWREVA